MDAEENEKKNAIDESLRKELGLPALTFEANAPAVDVQLLNRFGRGDKLAPEEVEKVLERLSRFESWRNQYVQVLLAIYKDHDRPTPSPPGVG